MASLIILLFKIQYFQGQPWTAGSGWTVPTGIAKKRLSAPLKSDLEKFWGKNSM